MAHRQLPLCQGWAAAGQEYPESPCLHEDAQRPQPQSIRNYSELH